eukprot:8759897-Pyramimonas_sp.AAC.1
MPEAEVDRIRLPLGPRARAQGVELDILRFLLCLRDQVLLVTGHSYIVVAKAAGSALRLAAAQAVLLTSWS